MCASVRSNMRCALWCGPSVSTDSDYSGSRSGGEQKARATSSGWERTVRIPFCDGHRKSEYQISYAYMSQRGFYPEHLSKANQDECCAREAFRGRADEVFFGVFDGHGEEGANCARFARKTLPESTGRCCSSKPLSKVSHVAYKSAFERTNRMLHDERIDDLMSGTTAVSAHISGRYLLIANVGDSRCIMGARNPKSGTLEAINLTTDHTPFRADEQRRVQEAGAHVLSIEQLEGRRNPNISFWNSLGSDGDQPISEESDPPRLWATNGMYPGTAFTRSIGDTAAESIGVISEPELTEVELTSDVEILVLASDGVFEFIPSQTVVDIVSQFEDQHDACNAIVQEAYRLWLQFDTRTDDISVVVASFRDLPSQEDGTSQAIDELQPSSRNNPKPLRVAGTRSKVAAIEVSSGGDEHDVSPELEEEEQAALVEPKSQDELDALEQAVKANFLFEGLCDEQRQRLLHVMSCVDVPAGSVIIRQGDPSEACYILREGVLDVYVSADEDPRRASGAGERHSVLRQGTNRVESQPNYGVHVLKYEAGTTVHPCFGELALIHNQPRAATVIARTDARVWSIQSSTYKRLLRQEQEAGLHRALTEIDALKNMSSAEMFRVIEHMRNVHFGVDDHILIQGHPTSTLFVIAEGEVVSEKRRPGDSEDAPPVESTRFGAWHCIGNTALRGQVDAESDIIADCNVRCCCIDPQVIEDMLAPLTKLEDSWKKSYERSQSYLDMPRHITDSMQDTNGIGPNSVSHWRVHFAADNLQLMSGWHAPSLRWCTMFAASLFKTEERRTTKGLTRGLREMRRLQPMPYIPGFCDGQVDKRWACMIIQTSAIGTMGMLLRSPASEEASAFYTACISLAVEHLHWQGILFRGISPYNMLVDERGHVQLGDFRFARPDDGRAYTLCGDPDFRAPEMVSAKGHDSAVDWWSVGVFAWWMLRRRTPFESETSVDGTEETKANKYKRLLRAEYTVPPEFSEEAEAMLTALLQRGVAKRVKATCCGVESLQHFGFFNKHVDFDSLTSPTALRDVNPPAETVMHLLKNANHRGYGNEPLDDVKCVESAEWLNDAF